MTNLGRVAVLLGAIAVVAIASPGCDGGSSTGTGGSAGSTTDGGGGDGGTAGATSTGGGGEGGTTSNGGGGTGGTAGSSDLGVQGTEFVSGGGVVKSTNFKMVFSLGQSTQNQGRTKSSGYVMQGGLIGATGSLK